MGGGAYKNIPLASRQVPAHTAVRVPEHAVLAEGRPRVQVRGQCHGPHEERIPGRPRDARQPRLPQHVHRAGGGRLPARLRLGFASHHPVRRRSASLGDVVLRAGRLEGELQLALNLGLRYDFITPSLEAQNRQANFDPTTGTLVQATDGSLADRGLVDPDKNNFAPRVGIVYTLDDKTVLRGGYGIFYNMFDRIGSEDQIALNPGNGLISLQPATATLATGPLFLLQNGFPPGYLDPSRIDIRRIALRGADRNSPKAMVHQFSVGAQRTFANVWVVSLDLVGTEGRNLANLINLNQPRGGINGPIPFPQVGLIQWREAKGESSYKGMDLQLEKRFSRGYSFGLAYTLSECKDNTAEHLATGGSPSRSQDAQDLAAWYGPCGYDTTHRFAGNFILELPMARNSTGATKAILGDWSLSGIYAVRSGRPFTVTQSSNNVGLYHTGLPNQTGTGEGPKTVDKWFEPADFPAVPSGVFGNAGRNNLRGPDWQSLDMSLQKRLSTGRSSNLDLPLGRVQRLQHRQPGPPGSEHHERRGGHDQPARGRCTRDAVLAAFRVLVINAGGCCVAPPRPPALRRSEFVSRAAVGGSGASSMTKSRIRVGNAPVSWGVYEADRPNRPFPGVLDAIAAAGYEGTESARTATSPPRRTRWRPSPRSASSDSGLPSFPFRSRMRAGALSRWNPRSPSRACWRRRAWAS